MGKTKAFFKCPDSLKAEFADSSCLLTISVGQATHEDEAFAATIDLVNESFAACTILVDDSLQRHNMALTSNQDAEFFYEIAIKEGDLWLERNKKYCEKLTIPTRILRWDRWLFHKDFNSQLEKIRAAFREDKIYAKTFNESINDFLTKYRTRIDDPDNFDLDRAYQLSLDFVMEECSALCLWIELGCQFEAYPIRHNVAINATRNKFVSPFHPKLLQAITIAFRNLGQLKPQRFHLRT